MKPLTTFTRPKRLSVLVALCMFAGVLVAPGQASADGLISSLSVNPSVVNNGASAQGTVTLVPIDSNPTTVLLFSSDSEAAAVPSSVVAPAGATTVDFTITTNADAAPTVVQITAAIANIPRTASLSVNPEPPPGPSLTEVSVTTDTLTGGSPVTGVVSFTGTTDGAVVQLASSDPAVVQVPGSVVVSGGAASGAFAVTTAPVEATTTATITATWYGITRTTTLTVTVGEPAPPDQVEITRSRWKDGVLDVRATSSDPTAILSVFSQSGAFIATMTNEGDGRYSIERPRRIDPNVIIVRSNLGGEDTAQTRN